MQELILLYAEDDLESRENYAFVLKQYFSQVYLAEDGREALELYYDKRPDMLLLDISMPFIDGLSVAKTVREKNKEIPIIILTAYSDKEKLLKAVPLCLEGYFLKPIDNKVFMTTVLKVIQKIKDKDMIPLKKMLKWNKINSHLLYKDKSINLTKKEKRLMELLSNSLGRYFMHDTLILHIWNDEIPDASHDNKLYQIVYRLNRKINAVTNSETQLIRNSYKLGYCVDCYFE